MNKTALFCKWTTTSILNGLPLLCGLGLMLMATGTARAQLLNQIWTIAPNTHNLDTGGQSRQLSYNPLSGNVIYITRTAATAGLNVNRVDGVTGTVFGLLNTNGITGGTIILNSVGVADDGAIYAANVSTSIPPSVKVYRWANEAATPTVAFSGDPSGNTSGRWADTIAVRGAGPATQILIGSDTNRVAVLTTSDGVNFTVKPLPIAAGTVGAYKSSLTFLGSNAFYAITSGNPMHRVSFDPVAGTATDLGSLTLPGVALTVGGLSFNVANNLLAAVTRDNTAGSVKTNLLYNASNPGAPVLKDFKNFASSLADSAAGQASAAFGGGRLFTLSPNNGILAFNISPFVTSQPSNATVNAGATVTFQVGASGTPPLAYQWLKNGSTLSGATSSNLTVGGVTCSNAGTYTVTVSGPGGTTTSSNAVLVVNDTIPPVMSCSNLTFNSSSCSTGAVVTFTVSSTDACDGSRPVTCNPPSGSTFPVGTTTVNCTSSDTHSNTANCSFSITVVCPLSLSCPPSPTVPASGPSGAVVTYPPPTVSGGCVSPPPSPACNPPSGSTFPVGTTTVTCFENEPCGASATCSFTVTVTQPPPPERFSTSNLLPPPDGMYISPQLYHQLYAQGIIISNISHRRFTQSQPPPAPGDPPQTHSFGSQVQLQISMGNGAPFQSVSAPAQVTVQVTPAGTSANGAASYSTEMMQLDISGGSLPPGVMVRESPTLHSTGQTTVRPVEGGFMIGSFFDVFTEISVDNGANWTPAQGPAHVELRGDPVAVASVPAPSSLLPPPNDLYVSPALYHLLLANGIVIKDVKHRFFTDSQPPPPPGTGPQQHHFDSQVDMQVSQDGGNTFTPVRAPAGVDVVITPRSSYDGIQVYDTEMLSLNLQGGTLPAGMMIRESPTRRSEGGTAIEPLATDGTQRIHSFFDIWTEVSLDNGANWTPATQAARVNLACSAPEVPKPSPNLPPPDGQYISPQLYHILTAQGIVISNISHRKFTQTFPPPPPGGTDVHTFGSEVGMDIVQPGQPVRHAVSPAQVTVRVTHTRDDGATSYYDTEMLALDISGGSLPAGVMIRESPSKASLGRTSIRMVNDPATGIWDYISSFFDIFPEVSIDGGQTWQVDTTGPTTMALVPTASQCTISIACPADITASATGAAGAVVNYPAPTVIGNCGPFNVACNPPSGSTFPIGTTVTTCTASDSLGNSATCSFKVNVRKPKPGFFPNPLLPPPNGVYISPRLYHQLYANGIIIRDIKHRQFLGSQPPPPPGQVQIHQFGSVVELEHSMDGGATFQKVSAPANCTVRVSAGAVAADGTQSFDTEMLQLDISGGSFPAGVMIRESPTLASTGQTTVRQVNGGFMIDSFFDIFTEISLDNGANWSPAQDAAHVELRPDIALIPPIPASTRLLPPPNDAYISPAQYHILTAQGVVIKDVRHSFFTHSMLPPPAGTKQTEQFDSQVDMMLSQDGGNTFHAVRAPAAVTVEVEAVGSADSGLYDTEMLSLNIQGGDLPPGVMIRESPTLASLGGTAIAQGPQPLPWQVSSFFDIFPEVSLDGGQNWSPAQGPVRVELVCDAPEIPKPNPNLPPLDGQYISPQKWHALYAQGIIISNVSHTRFTQTQPPPPPGGTQIEQFGSQIDMMLSLNGGQTWSHVQAPAAVQVRVTSTQDEGDTRFFETEMLALNIQGGGLPAGVMIRESPSKASLGRTSIRMVNDPATGIWDYISSFFDIFTEVSIDNGANWLPAVSAPAHMVLTVPATQCTLAIRCPADITVVTRNPAGAVVNYPAPTVAGNCGPFSVVCNPPSGSTFPIGTTTVTCTATDSQNNTATCSFKVTVVQRIPPPPKWLPNPLLPPPNGAYISPQRWHQLYQNGIIISNVSHRRFLQSFPAPAPGTTEVHSFGSTVEVAISQDGGTTFQKVSAPANCSVRVSSVSSTGGVFAAALVGTQTFDTEMLALDIAGGTLPPSVMIRESPTLASTGRTTIQDNPGGGFLIDSFFDVFTEISVDGGVSWSPAVTAGLVELQTDSQAVTPIVAPSRLLPPPNDLYVSPQQYHILLQQGIVVRNVRHKLFTQSLPPPGPGVIDTHSFGSQVDLELSQDGGNTFRPMRAPAQVTVSMQLHGTAADGTETYDTEMLQLDISGGDLPAGLMIRESPTLASLGGTAIAQADTDGDGVPDAYRIGSFFDIFPEVSLDSGASWTPAQGAAHVELICDAPPIPLPNPNLPPLNGQYISPQLWHALYQQGIIISNVSHKRFTQTFPPPQPGVLDTHSFGSQVECDLSLNNGQTWQHTSIPATVTVTIRQSASDGSTRYFDTEMTSLSLQGGVLPAGVMIRESPSKASLGRTSVQTMPDGTYRIGSFFDIFTEATVDGGQTWPPSLSGPGTVHVAPIPTSPLTVTCPPNRTITASGPAGAIVNYPPPTTAGGCPPATVVCNPPSGSTFPVGTTTVTCTAGDACNGSATCVFTVTVNPPVGNPCFEPDNGSGTVTLPPQGCQYLSPDQVHMIIDGLPAGTTIELAAIHKEFICHQQGGAPCSNDCFTVDDCNPANGATEQFNSTLQLRLHGTGALAGWDRTLSIPNMFCQSQVGPRTPGQPVQSFDTDMQGIQGQLPPGDPDFDLLRITAGSGFGMPSPGHTTLTRQAGGNWAVDSFFDITYRIDFIGHSGGHVGGMSGSTTGTIRMVATPSPALAITCPPDKMITASGPAGAIVNFAPTTSGGCPPVTVVCNPPSGSTFPVGTTTVTCTASDACGQTATCVFNINVKPPVGNPCFEPDNGTGTVTLPPQGCQYLSPDQVHMIIDGLPPGTTVELAAIHKEFICHQQQTPCSNDCFTVDDCNPANGATEQFNSSLELHLHGTGALAGWDRTLTIPNLFCQSQVGPHTPGNPVQSFDTDMQNIQGQLPPGDPDFDLLRVTAGSGFGLPSPGHTTLTRQAGGNWAVDSFFDITYRIDFIGHAGGHVGGMSGSTTGTIRMVAVPGTPCVQLTCPTNIAAWTCNQDGTKVTFAPVATNVCGGGVTVTCSPPSGSNFPVGTTPVTCTAASGSGTPVTCTFTVTVRLDTLAPALVCPNDVVVRTCNDRELVFYTVTATDECDPSPRLVCNPPSGSSFPIGSTPVNCTATDACGHKTNCTFIVVLIQEPLPKMTITLLGNNQIRVCWNTVCPGYLLQCTKGLETPTMWQTITNVPTLSNNTNYCVTLPMQPNRRFYRLIRRTPQEVFMPTNTLPPIGSYNSPSGEVTVFANGLITRWFVHRIPPQPCPPNCPIPPCPTCPDPIILTFSTTLDFQYSSDGGQTFQNANTGNFDTRVQVHGSISGGQIGPVGTLDTEIVSMTSALPGGVMVRESPTLASTGKHRIRTIDGGYMISSFFDVFLELSTDGGQTWSPSLGAVHVDLNAAVPTIPSGTDIFPPAGSYNSISNVPTRYLNGLIARNFRHVVPPPSGSDLTCPPFCPPPCLTCPPGQYDFPTALSFQVSTDSGLTFQDVTVQNVQSRARARHTQDTSDTRFFDTELLSLQSPPLAGGVMLRESPSRQSLGKTSVQRPAGSAQFRIGSFFDVFTEVSLDGGQTWSPVVDPTHLELNPSSQTP